MDDIEDITFDLNSTSLRRNTPQLVGLSADNINFDQEEKVTGLIPGNEKVFFQTFGCAHNVSDGEYMKGQLSSYGYALTDKPENADIWVLNSCTVKSPSESHFLSLVNKAKAGKKHVLVSGCVPQADRGIKDLEDVSVLGVNNIDQVVYAVEETVKGNTVKLLSRNSKPSLFLPKVRKNKLVEIVPINTGCLGNCTYCKTKHARGKLGSYTVEQISKRVQDVLEDGVQQVWFASEDTGAFGRDIGSDIGKLLSTVISHFEPYNGTKMAKLGMTNPPYILAHLDILGEILNHQCMFAFIHIPVQAGSNKVLDVMKREYTVEQFSKIVDYLVKYVPDITIATDIICGFPGETEEDFEETMDLIRKYKFPVVNISKFYARPGTPAAKMKQIDSVIKKQRSKRLTDLFESYHVFDFLKDQVKDVWFGEEIYNKNGQSQIIGHTKEFVKVCVNYERRLVGTRRKVHIRSTDKYHVIGELVDPNE